MHGFGVMGTLGRAGLLHPVAMHLRRHGVWAYAPNVAPYDTVAARAAMWQTRLEQVRSETGAPRVNLIAHSMGGLDARFLISTLGHHEHVATLTTISAPHRGSSIARVLLDQPERIQALLSGGLDWMGVQVLEDADANFRNAVAELTPEHLANVFNPHVADHPDVVYWSYAGAAGRGTNTPLNPVLFPLNSSLYKREGPNDGFVSLDSAPWGTFLGHLPADHMQQVGIGFPGSSSFNAKAFYTAHVEMLAAQGF
jgi:triacylglycerol lipase